MSEGTFLDISGDGVAAGYPSRTVLPKLVAPSTGDEFNTLQPHLETVGCALVPDHQFEYDSSFILPAAQRAFRKLVALIKTRPKCPLSVFGHADPEGPDRYNKVLSGRRALADLRIELAWLRTAKRAVRPGDLLDGIEKLYRFFFYSEPARQVFLRGF